MSEVTLAFLRGELHSANPELKKYFRSGRDFYYNNGAIAFMLGDIDLGVHYWSKISGVRMRRLFNVAHSSEKFFARGVIEDPRYQDVLERLGAGKSWQRQLMEGIMAMEPVTGVKLSPAAQEAFENNTMLIRNTLWPQEVWAEVESRRHAADEPVHATARR